MFLNLLKHTFYLFSVYFFFMNFTTTNVKSNKIAEAIRAKGYKMFQNGHLYEALLKFNKSLCTAEAGTKTMGLIYMNRAEAFFKLKLYENCLNNIQLARADYCTIEGNKLLTELEEKCLELNDVNAERENPWEFFKLTYPPNKKLPYVVDCLEVKTDKKYGRYIITNQAFNVGDIIAIEKPFFKLIKTDPEDDQYPETNLYQYCANCLADNLMDLIPCPRCLSTMFCSNLCQRTANKGFHHYECQILDLLNETGDWRMVLRSFFDALSICDGSVEEMRRLMDESDELSPSVFNFDFSKPENVETAKNKLKCLIGLERKVDVEMKDLSNIFLQHQELAEIWSSHSAFVNKFLERMMQIEILNFHEIIGKSLNNCYRSCLGDGAYVFCSLLNHSCCPNTMRIVVENRMVLVVERPIKKGEQLFDCYIG